MARKKQKAKKVAHRQSPDTKHVPVERVQTGVRMEKRMVKVLKGMAEYTDRSLGELLEEIVLHSFEKGAFAFGPRSLLKIKQLKQVYDMDYDVHASYRFAEKEH